MKNTELICGLKMCYEIADFLSNEYNKNTNLTLSPEEYNNIVLKCDEDVLQSSCFESV